VEGGSQLHLSHNYPALECVASYVSEGDNSSVPPGKLPDRIGEARRLRLVTRNMFGFVMFDIIVLTRTERSTAVKLAGVWDARTSESYLAAFNAACSRDSLAVVAALPVTSGRRPANAARASLRATGCSR
jgi:hypothetical protein